MTLLILCFYQWAWSKTPCAPFYEKMSSMHELWNSEIPIKVNRAAQFNEFTFSFDGELTYYELIKFLKKDPEILPELDRVFGKEYTKKEMLKLLNISEKQFDTFVIKDKSKTVYKLYELPPKYFGFAMDSLMDYGIGFRELYMEFESVALKYLKKNQFPVEAHYDSGFIEITHETFENVPKKFHELMYKLDDHFADSTMHLHLGVPERSISKEEMIFVANATEARMTLQLVENDIERTLPYNDTTIGQLVFTHDNESSRGILKLALGDFAEGKVHNLEIRQYSTMAEGMDYLAFSSFLAKNHKNLKMIKTADDYFLHPFYGNVQGAIDFLGQLYKTLPESHYQAWSKKMLTMAREMNETNYPAMIKDLQKFLKETQLLDDLKTNQNLYLDFSNKS